MRVHIVPCGLVLWQCFYCALWFNERIGHDMECQIKKKLNSQINQNSWELQPSLNCFFFFAPLTEYMRIHILELLLWLCISVTCKLYETTQMVCVCHLSLKIRIPSDSSAEEIMNRRACNDAVCGGVSSAPLICLSSHVSLLITRSWGCWRRCWGSVTGSTLRASWIRCQLSTPPPTRPSPSHCANCSTWSWSRSTAGTAFRRALSWACNSVWRWFMYRSSEQCTPDSLAESLSFFFFWLCLVRNERGIIKRPYKHTELYMRTNGLSRN